MKKLILKTVLCLFALITPLCMMYGEETFTASNFAYTVENGNASITDYTGNDENLIIPEKLGGYDVRHIGDEAFSWCESLASIVIPDSVTSIAYGAFGLCSSLVTLTVSKNHSKR